MLTVDGIVHQFSDPYEVHRILQRDRVKKGFAHWLTSFDVDTWATWTFRAKHWPEVYMASCQRHVEWWCDDWSLDPCFYVVEEGGHGGRLHAHGLFNSRGMKLRKLWGDWFHRYGRCRFTPLKDRTDGVRNYVAKYVVKDQLWFNLRNGSPFRGELALQDPDQGTLDGS